MGGDFLGCDQFGSDDSGGGGVGGGLEDEAVIFGFEEEVLAGDVFGRLAADDGCVVGDDEVGFELEYPGDHWDEVEFDQMPFQFWIFVELAHQLVEGLQGEGQDSAVADLRDHLAVGLLAPVAAVHGA